MAEDYYLVTCPHCDTGKYIFKDAFTPKRKKLVRDILCNNLVCLKSLKGLYPRKFEPVTEVSATDRFEIDRSNLPFFQEENKELKKILIKIRGRFKEQVNGDFKLSGKGKTVIKWIDDVFNDNNKENGDLDI